ncbi:MAG: hypothetical protein WC804_17075 [Sphingomonas sp.]|jgi:hypothetical protein|uniref:hypothetical protein n=1 Tax=Sphingomonas sp. TaxID=28214 RepID=UPI0035670B5B
MENIVLRADCARCSALCCVALAFDQSSLFAIDKASGQTCPNLNACGRCSIHANRGHHGYQGCVDFDCFGAGQRVTQEFFGGDSWIEQPSLRKTMSRAFLALLRAHECLVLLHQARKLDLASSDRRRIDRLCAEIECAGISEELLQALRRETLDFLKTLQVYVERNHVTDCALSS